MPSYRWTNRLREIRALRGLTLTELSRRSGISRQTLSAVEADPHYALRAELMLRLAQTLGDPGLFRIEDGAPVEAVS